jgi:hypothetical protein
MTVRLRDGDTMSRTLLAGLLMLGFVACSPAPAPASAAASIPDQPAANTTPCVLRDLSDCSRADLQRLHDARDRQARDQQPRDQRARDDRSRDLPPSRVR